MKIDRVLRVAVPLLAAWSTLARAQTHSISLGVSEGRIDAVSKQLHLRLENRGTFEVTAFMIKTPYESFIQEFLPPRVGVLPHASYDFVLTTKATESLNLSAYRVSALLSVNGIEEGDEGDVANIRLLRTGRAYRLSRLLESLEALRRSPDSALGEGFRRLLAQLSGSSPTMDDGTQAVGFFANGINNANTMIRVEVERAAAVASTGYNEQARVVLSNAIARHTSILDALHRSGAKLAN